MEFITWRITALSVELECKKRGINKVDEPIISPWLIYLIGSVDGVLALVGIIGFCSLVLAVACFMESITSYLDENEKHEWRKRSKIFLIGSIIFISLFTLIPNSKTLAAMILTQYLTPNSIKANPELITSIDKNDKDKVIEIIREIKK